MGQNYIFEMFFFPIGQNASLPHSLWVFLTYGKLRGIPWVDLDFAAHLTSDTPLKCRLELEAVVKKFSNFSHGDLVPITNQQNG